MVEWVLALLIPLAWGAERFTGLPESAQQLLHVRDGRLSLLERSNGRWKERVSFPVVVGKNGVAPLNTKREGDGKTPAGLWRLGTAFGYAPTADTRLPYRQATVNSKYVDDPEHPDYNHWIEGPTTARSFERMRRPDGLYEHGIVIRYNEDPVVPGRGSAIFLHIWRGPAEGTAGCVAMPRERMLEVLAWVKDALILIE